MDLKIKTESSTKFLSDTLLSPFKNLQLPKKFKQITSSKSPIHFKISKLVDELQIQFEKEKSENRINQIKSWIIDMCNCYNYCYSYYNFSDLKQSEKTKFECISINVDIHSQDIHKYKTLMENAFKFMIENKYIVKIGSIYYIILNDLPIYRLTWENIKELLYIYKDKNETSSTLFYELHSLFWMFRKTIIDCLLKLTINELKSKYSDNILVFNVGSNKPDSDYDITLYSKNDEFTSNVIKKFEKSFIRLFGEHSSIVFDTNIYGISYITYQIDNSYMNLYNTIDAETCSVNSQAPTKLFYLSNINDIYKNSQIVWAFIKYLKNFRQIFSSKVFYKYITFLKSKTINNKFIEISTNTFTLLNNTNRSYANLISKRRFINNIYKNYFSSEYNEHLFLNDYISLVNFYGTETYFTRGAFLDTVLNTQICNSPINLTEQDYIASILENTGFFFIHNDKPKYLIRVLNSFKILYNINVKYSLNDKSELFQNLNNATNDTTYCTLENFDLINNCQKFQTINNLIKLITHILKIYFQINNFFHMDFPFYQFLKEVEMFKSKHNLEPNSNYKSYIF